jgi:hypothetical protein
MNVKKRNKSAAVLTALCIIICLAASKGATASSSDEPTKDCTDTIYIKTKLLSKSHRFTLTPDADNKVVFFSVKGVSGRVYQLYVFDVDGKLIGQTEIRNKQTTLINNIEKGSYFFDVFTDDMRIGHGQIAVR